MISGGGSGHEPLHTGFVGRGMLDAAVPGGIFASPTALQVQAATTAIDRGRGVVHIVKNYTGDVMNFGIARRDAPRAEVETVLVDDDVATESEDGPGRRGTAAVIAVEKICGAAAARGAALAARSPRSGGAWPRARARWRSRCTRRRTRGRTRPSFDLAAGEIELGVGIHGERGVGRRPFAPAAELAEALLDAGRRGARPRRAASACS